MSVSEVHHTCRNGDLMKVRVAALLEHINPIRCLLKNVIKCNRKTKSGKTLAKETKTFNSIQLFDGSRKNGRKFLN